MSVIWSARNTRSLRRSSGIFPITLMNRRDNAPSSERKTRKEEKTSPFLSFAFLNFENSWPQFSTTPWILCEKSKQEATSKSKRMRTLLLRVRRQMLLFTIPRIYPLGGTVSRFLTGCTSCMGLVSSINARSVETLAIGEEEPSRCIFRSGDTLTGWSVSRSQTQSTSKTLPRSTMRWRCTRNSWGSPRRRSSGLTLRSSSKITKGICLTRRPT
jgi:hypothetical protein